MLMSMEKLTFKLEAKNIPLVTLGTSPFIGAGQFGSQGILWREKFLKNPTLMAKMMKECYTQGSRGVEAIPAGQILAAVEQVRQDYPDFHLIASTYWDPSNLKIEELAQSHAQLIFIHGAVADKRDHSLLTSILKQIRDIGALPGIATHDPANTISFVQEKQLDCPVMLIPFNINGYAMGQQKVVEDLVDNSDLTFIGMKTLAAGQIRPQKAFDYISQHRIAGVAIGMVTEDEINETVPIALKALTK